MTAPLNVRIIGRGRVEQLLGLCDALEAWDNLDGITILSGQPAAVPAPVKEELKYEVSASLEAMSVREEAQPVDEDPVQPMLSDFGLYKCQACGKMIMGYEKKNHVNEEHVGKRVEWRKGIKQLGEYWARFLAPNWIPTTPRPDETFSVRRLRFMAAAFVMDR